MQPQKQRARKVYGDEDIAGRIPSTPNEEMDMPVHELFSLRGQVALVTGGGAGIGKAICLMFAEAGADVACTDLKLDEAESVASECRKLGRQVLALKLDVTNEPERCATVEQTVQHLGKLTILVNNAGGGGPKPLDMPMSDFERAFQLNLFSVFRMCQLCAPHVKAAGGGAIVNISSMAGQNKNRLMCSYGASKAAVDHHAYPNSRACSRTFPRCRKR